MVVPEIFDTHIVLYYTGNAKIQTAEDDSGLDVLDEGQNVGSDLKTAHVANISVYKPVSNALPRVTQNLVPQFHPALVNFTTFRGLIDDFGIKDVHLPHFFVNERQILNIGCRIFNHSRS